MQKRLGDNRRVGRDWGEGLEREGRSVFHGGMFFFLRIVLCMSWLMM